MFKFTLKILNLFTHCLVLICREEIDHLMKILHSRAVTEEQDRKTPSMTSPDNVDRAGISKRSHKTSLDEEEELNRFQLVTSSPLSRPAVSTHIAS